MSKTLGRYEILGELGKGAMGVVYLARDPIIGRKVAIKSFRIGFAVQDEELEQFRTRFLREAQSAGILSHPGIVTIHDVIVDEEKDAYYIAMEYVEGTDLKQILRRDRRLAPAIAADTAAQIAEALDYAHSKGVVHRDIKPANIIVTESGVVKITDFGIARMDASNLTVEGQLLGTPNYMAPEQVRGRDVDHRADLFSLGVMFYEMLTGRKPFAADNLTAVSHRIVYEPFNPPTDYVEGLPEELVRIIERALQKAPADRFPTAGEMAAELRRARQAIERRESDGAVVEADEVFTPVPGAMEAVAAVARERASAAIPSSAAPPQTPLPPAPPPPTPPPVAPPPAARPPAAGEVLSPLPSFEEQVDRADAQAELVQTIAVPPDGPPPRAVAPAVDRDGTVPAAAVRRTSPGLLGTGPLRAAVAAAVGLALGLVLALVVWSRMPDEEIVDRNQPEHLVRREVLPLLVEGRSLMEEGSPAAAQEVLARAVARAPDLSAARRLKERADRQVLALEGHATVADFVEVRLAEALEAERRRDWVELADLAARLLAVVPEHEQAAGLAGLAAERIARRAVAAPVGVPRPPPPAPAPAPAADRPAGLVVDFYTEVPEGILTIYAGQEKLVKEDFSFVEKKGLFRRSVGKPGGLTLEREVAPGSTRLLVYLYRGKDSEVRNVQLDVDFEPGRTSKLYVRVDAEGRIQARVE